MNKIAVVTGANRGLGLAIVKELLKRHPNWTVYLTARSRDRGLESVQQISREMDVMPSFHELDVRSVASVQAFSSHLRSRQRRIDILINNAGVFPKQCQINLYHAAPKQRQVFTYDLKMVRQIVNTNFFGTLNVCRQLIPLLSDDSRVINVSSSLSQLAFNQLTPQLQEAIRNCRSIDDVSCLINAFLALPPTHYVKSGWMSKLFDEYGCFYGDVVPYGLTKIGINLITQIFQRNLDTENTNRLDRNIIINSCSPGTFRSETKLYGRRWAQEGAQLVYNIASTPSNSILRGQYVHDRRIEDPFTGVAIRNSYF